MNDGSADNFAGSMREVAARNSQKSSAILSSESVDSKNSQKINVKIINQKHRGASAARNAGFSESAGRLVIFWDADTVARPRMLEKMKKMLDNHPESSYVYSQFRFGWKKMKSHKFSADLLKQMNYIDTTSLIRRIDAAAFDESLNRFQDWDLWLTMLENNKTGILIPEVLFKKIAGGRKGISRWLPSFFYKLPWRLSAVQNYRQALEIVLKKHKQANH